MRRAFSISVTFALGAALATATARAAVLVEYDAAVAGAGVDPTGVFPAWQRFGTPMTNNGTFLLQNNTADDPGNDQSGEYLSPSAGAGLMKLTSGAYGIEVRVRPLTDVPNLAASNFANLYVFWSDDTYAYNITIDKDTDDGSAGTTGGIRYGQNSMASAVTGIDWSTPHTIFIGYVGAAPSGGTFRFYVDGDLKATVPAADMARTGGFPFAQDRVDFGDGTTGQNFDVAAEWYAIRIHDVAVAPGSTVLMSYDAAVAGAGVEPNDVGWQRFGTDMVNNGTFLLQDNTADDPTTQSGEYLSPTVGNVMTRGTGEYGIEVRVQPLNDVPFLGSSHYANMYVFWSDDQFAYNITIDKDTDDAGGGTTGGIRYGQNSLASAVTGVDWSTPHTIYVGYRGYTGGDGTFDFYVDNVYKASASGNNMARTGGFPFAQNRVDFGDGTTGQGIDGAARWYFIKIHNKSYPVTTIPTGLLIDYTASVAGAGVDPTGVAPPWRRFGSSMTNNGTFLVQDNTVNDPLTESGEYLSYPIGGLMKLGSGQYGIEFKIRPLGDVKNLAASNYSNLYVTWSDDQYSYNLTIDKDTDDDGPETTGGIRYGTNSMTNAVTGIDWSVAHKVFIGYRGSALPAGEFDLYVDSVLKATIPAGNIARVGSFARDSVDFGDGTTGQGYDVAAEWYFVRVYGSATPPPEPPPPCGVIFADRDLDGDVDMDDYAAFQRCYTGQGGGLLAGCSCFDRPEPGFPNGDGDVDTTDLARFTDCFTRANIPANPACDGP